MCGWVLGAVINIITKCKMSKDVCEVSPKMMNDDNVVLIAWIVYEDCLLFFFLVKLVWPVWL